MTDLNYSPQAATYVQELIEYDGTLLEADYNTTNELEQE